MNNKFLFVIVLMIIAASCGQREDKRSDKQAMEDIGNRPLELIDTIEFLENPEQDVVVKKHLKRLYAHLHEPLDSLFAYFELKKSDDNHWSEQVYQRELLPGYEELLCLLSLNVPEPGKEKQWTVVEFRLSGIIKDGELIVYRLGELRRRVSGEKREFWIEQLFGKEDGYLQFEKAFISFYGTKPNAEELFDYSRRYGNCSEGSDNSTMMHRLESKLRSDHLALLQSPNSELQLYGVSLYQYFPEAKWSEQERKLIQYILNKKAMVRTCEQLSESSYSGGIETIASLKDKFVFK